MSEAFLGFGGNIDDARKIVDEAVREFCDGVAVRLIARSSDYRTSPWGVTDQPPFINLCLRVETALSPRALLKRALSVEANLGRDRGREIRWGPRPIDIDLLAYDQILVDEPGLRLPHPEVLTRAFVLVPLAQIVPDRMIAGTRVDDALAAIDASGIEPLPSRGTSE